MGLKFIDPGQGKLYATGDKKKSPYQCIPEGYRICKTYELGSVRINLAQNWNEDELNNYGHYFDFIKTTRCCVRDIRGVGGWDYIRTVLSRLVE